MSTLLEVSMSKLNNNLESCSPESSLYSDSSSSSCTSPSLKMAWRVRSSKFRHVFGSAAKKENCYEYIKITKNAHDSNFCDANPKFIAIVTECAGGGSFLVLPLSKVGRVDINAPKVCGHAGPVLDVKWSPFNDNVIASCSDDTTIKVWQIPADGLHENLTEWLVDLHGHQRRVGYIEWHPTAENILLSAGYDFQCILWNVETAEPINVISVHNDTIFSIAWNRDGSLFATTCKDKKIRVIDPREGNIVAEGPGHPGTKASKIFFIGSGSRLFCTGFSRASERQFGVWDYKNLSKPLKIDSIDSSSGVLLPYYDPDNNIVYLAGKGDGNVRYFELVDDPPYCHYLSQYQSGSPQRGLGMMCKRGLDTSKCEVMRLYKLHTSRSLVEPVSMIVPRKSEMFQDDLYPPTASACPSLTADEWISGQNRDPILVSLKEGHIITGPPSRTAKAVQRKVTTSTASTTKTTTTPTTTTSRPGSARKQRSKDGVLSQAPTITTYRAVKRGSSTTTGPTTGVNKRSAALVGRSASLSTPTEKLPASVRNIKKLSGGDEDNTQQSEVDRVQVFDTKRTVSLSQTTTRMTNSNAPMRVDRKTWQSAYTSASVDVPATNGVPKTDPESVLSQPTSRQPVESRSHQRGGGPATRSSSMRSARSPARAISRDGEQQGITRRLSDSSTNPNQDKLYGRQVSSQSNASDYFTPPSSPGKRGSRAKEDLSPVLNGTPSSSHWASNPLYGSTSSNRLGAGSRQAVPSGGYSSSTPVSTPGSHMGNRSPGQVVPPSGYASVTPVSPGGHIGNRSPRVSTGPVDTSQLDDVLNDVLKDFESTASRFRQPTLKKSVSEYLPIIPPSDQVELPTLQQTQRALSENNIQGPFASVTASSFIPQALQINEEDDSSDLDKQAMLDCISEDAPDDTLIKPSKLRASMRNRKARSSFRGSKQGVNAESVVNDEPQNQPSTNNISPQLSPRIPGLSGFPGSSGGVSGAKSFPTLHNGGPELHQPSLPVSYSSSHMDNTGAKYNNDFSHYRGTHFNGTDPLWNKPENKVTEINNNNTRQDRRSRRDERSKTDSCIMTQPPPPSTRQRFMFSLSPERAAAASRDSDRLVFTLNSQAPDPPPRMSSSTGPLDLTKRSHMRSLRSNSQPEIDDLHSEAPLLDDYWTSSSVTPETNPSSNIFTNGTPPTDGELRKAYFRQLEEIRSLKENISMKDKRIRQLEGEVRNLRNPAEGESNC